MSPIAHGNVGFSGLVPILTPPLLYIFGSHPRNWTLRLCPQCPWVIKGLGVSSVAKTRLGIYGWTDPRPLIEKRRGLSPGGRAPPSFIHQGIIITKLWLTKLWLCSRPEDGMRCRLGVTTWLARSAYMVIVQYYAADRTTPIPPMVSTYVFHPCPLLYSDEYNNYHAALQDKNVLP